MAGLGTGKHSANNSVYLFCEVHCHVFLYVLSYLIIIKYPMSWYHPYPYCTHGETMAQKV